MAVPIPADLVKIHFSADTPAGTLALAAAPAPRSAEELFLHVKSTFLQWHADSPRPYSLTVYATVQSRDAAYTDLVEQFCSHWNGDADIASLPATHVEVSLSYKGDAWIGCTTVTDPLNKNSSACAMHAFEFAPLMAKLEAQQLDLEEAERRRRRANPVENPVPLPSDLASEIAKYLRLEFGEDGRRKGSVKVADLVFDGEHVVDGVPTQFWRYPARVGEPGWVTAERFEDHYCISVASAGPPDTKKKKKRR